MTTIKESKKSINQLTHKIYSCIEKISIKHLNIQSIIKTF